MALTDLTCLPACLPARPDPPPRAHPFSAGAPEYATVFLADKYIKPWTLLAIAFFPAGSRLLNDLWERLRVALEHVQAAVQAFLFNRDRWCLPSRNKRNDVTGNANHGPHKFWTQMPDGAEQLTNAAGDVLNYATARWPIADALRTLQAGAAQDVITFVVRIAKQMAALMPGAPATMASVGEGSVGVDVQPPLPACFTGNKYVSYTDLPDVLEVVAGRGAVPSSRSRRCHTPRTTPSG